MTGLVVDLFAGGGGASTGLEAALGRPVDLAINHDSLAIAVHTANHPATRHLAEDIWKVDPLEATGGAPVDVLWASPDCTHFSVAKGGKPRKKKIRSLAWRVVDWARAVSPRIIFLENVAEFRTWGPLDRQGKPIEAKKGFEFQRFLRALKRLGYAVDYRVLDASLYGAPTKRRRLFLIARRDGQPICWPEPTHGPGRLPVHTAAECIDWSIHCPSIFERKRPLAEKTMWRIAEGLRRFVIDNPQPYTVGVGGRAGQSSPTAASAPLGTVTAKNDRSLVVPTIVRTGQQGSDHSYSHAPEEPLRTIVTKAEHLVVAPALMRFRHDSPGADLSEPMPTVTAGGSNRERPAAAGHALGLVAPSLVKVNHGKREARGEAIDEPLSTVTASQRGHALVAPTLVQTGYGERPGQAARALDLMKPLGTLVDGQKHAAVAAFLAKGFGEEPGRWPGASSQALDAPAPTITTRDHNSLAAVALATFRGTDASHPGAASVGEPLPVVSAGGIHVAEVRAFLTAFYGTDGTAGKGQRIDQPLRTITARHRLGLVTVEGVDYQIVDIGMRMLEPHELLRAQFGRFAASYDLSAAKTKSGQVRLIGNSVCPEIAEAIVRANVEAVAVEGVA